MVKGANDEGNVTTTVRLPPKLLGKLRKVAKRERRSQSGIIEAALKDYFERQEGEPLTAEQEAAIEAYLERRLQPEK